MNPPRITDTPIVLWAIVDPEGTVHPGGTDEQETWLEFLGAKAAREWDPMSISYARQSGWPRQENIDHLKAEGYRAVRLACTPTGDEP